MRRSLIYSLVFIIALIWSFLGRIVFAILIVASIIGLIYLFYWDFKKRNTICVDTRGYERNGYGKLIHRDLAYNHIYKDGYKDGEYARKFREYDVHHIDGNKRNNSLDNLQILTREEHEGIHRRERKKKRLTMTVHRNNSIKGKRFVKLGSDGNFYRNS